MSPDNLYIKNPSVTLYAFHLRSELGSEVVKEAAELWEKLTTLSEKFAIPELHNFTNQLICYQNGHYSPAAELSQTTEHLELLPQRVLDFHQTSPTSNLTLRGSLYPVKLHDVYAVDLTLFYANQQVEISQLSQLNPQGCLSPAYLQTSAASLGQTLLLYAEPLEGMVANQALAEACLQAFWRDSPAALPPLVQSGQLLGGAIFEYEIGSEQVSNHIHILVWLGNTDTLKQAETINSHLLNLFCCRNKILYSYAQSRQSNTQGRSLYAHLEQYNHTFKQSATTTQRRLQELQRLLEEMPVKSLQYAERLRELQDYHTTIEANLLNYQNWLENIRQLSQPEDKLEFLQFFYNRSCSTLQKQIQIDLNYLTPGQQLFAQLIPTLQGLVEVHSIASGFERQHHLEIFVALLAFTLEGAAISVKLDYDHQFAEHILAVLSIPHLENFWGNHFLEMLIHLLASGLPLGVVGILLMILLPKLFR
jgi:hypothetical protein